MFPSSTKREIRHFHVVIVRRRQRNLQKSVIQVQSCYFVNLNLLVFCLPRCRRRPPCLSSLTTGTARATATATATRTSNKQNYNSTPAARCLAHFFAVIARQRREIPSRDGVEFVDKFFSLFLTSRSRSVPEEFIFREIHLHLCLRCRRCQSSASVRRTMVFFLRIKIVLQFIPSEPGWSWMLILP